MNYSGFFTEISFYSETLKAYQMGIWWFMMPDTTGTKVVYENTQMKEILSASPAEKV